VLTETSSKSFCGGLVGTMISTWVGVGRSEAGVGVLLAGGSSVSVGVGTSMVTTVPGLS